MVVVSVTYPATEGSRFDLEYYTGRHLPLVQSRWGDCGLVETKILRGIGVPGGGPAAYHLIALLTFQSEQDFQRAAQQHGREIIGDIKNFTDAEPVIQLNEHVG